MDRKTEIEVAIRDLLRARGGGKTICPSEVARALYSESDWRSAMADVRAVARTMPDVECSQRGVVVDPDSARGPIRLQWSCESR